MNTPPSISQDPEPYPWISADLAQLLAGLARQKEDLGPIADELIDLLRIISADFPDGLD